METYSFSELSEEILRELVELHIQIDTSDTWDALEKEGLTAAEVVQIDYHKSILRNLNLVVLNESTLWARAIYPLLVLAEHAYIRAWTGVPLRATYPSFQLEGVADGALAPAAAGKPRHPYFIVYEAKREVNAPDPQVQFTAKCSLLRVLIGKMTRNRHRARKKFLDAMQSLAVGISFAVSSWILTPRNRRSQRNVRANTTGFLRLKPSCKF